MASPRRVAVVFGSTFGDTAAAAQRIAAVLEQRLDRAVPCVDVVGADLAALATCDLLVAGTSTWHGGDLQDDWADALAVVARIDWHGCRVALFGLGDQLGYPDTFVDGLADLAAAFEGAGARLVGSWPRDGYDHVHSRAERGDAFLGLALDETQQPERSAARIRRWCDLLLAQVSGPPPTPRSPRDRRARSNPGRGAPDPAAARRRACG